MLFQRFKYLSIAIIPFATYSSITTSGWWTWTHFAYLLILLPVVEIVLGTFKYNLNEEQQDQANDDIWYDMILYLLLPLQYFFLFYFLINITNQENSMVSLIGKMTGMGLMSGVLAINVAHELGHRKKKYEKLFAKILLLSTLYMHFFIEHNKGHHKNVATNQDPATARYGENLYSFWIRSLIFSYLSAWKIENKRMKTNGQNVLSLNNEMLQFQLIQALFIALVYFFFGPIGAIGLLGSSLFGILLLETVNYIQHYGLQRTTKKDGTYERVGLHHSWNSGYPLGRVLLFELARHSDHHFLATKKYQVLNHIDESPQMPTGYTGMITMALFPPLWFLVMNPLVRRLN